MREPERVMSDRTRIFWFESPNNPHLRCVDIKRVAEACRARNVVSVIDNTFASPLNQRPLAMGVDLAMQSATKYLNGHSDVTAGVVSGSRALVRPVEMARRRLGGMLDPQPAYALNRSLKTLGFVSSATMPTRWRLRPRSRHIRPSQGVFYPGLASHPDHRVASARCPDSAAWCASTCAVARRPRAARSIA